MIIGFKPYAFFTLNLNSATTGPAAERKLTDAMKDVFLRADQRFLNTRTATKRPAHQRFEGIYFFEKLSGNPHVHVLLFTPPGGDTASETSRLKFLIRNFTTEFTNLLAADYELAFDTKIEPRAKPVPSPHIREIDGRFTSHIRSVSSFKAAAEYITKELKHSQFDYDFISKFYSSQTMTVKAA